MGIEVSPQGIVTALIVFAVAALAFVNRKSLAGLLPKADPEKHADGVTEIDVRQTEAQQYHPLDVMKILSTLNEEQDLKISRQLTEIYTILTSHVEFLYEQAPQDVFDLMKSLTIITEQNGIDCQEELKAIYAKIVSRKTPETVKP